MSAQPDTVPQLRRMEVADLEGVHAIERSVYSHPWTAGNFTDSMDAGYDCWVLEQGGCIAGYCVVMVAAGEAHLLNLSVAATRQRRGLGGVLLDFAVKLARERGAASLYLEVRASNTAGRALYARHGFAEIGQRRGYYPHAAGREDAVTMERKL